MDTNRHRMSGSTDVESRQERCNLEGEPWQTFMLRANHVYALVNEDDNVSQDERKQDSGGNQSHLRKLYSMQPFRPLNNVAHTRRNLGGGDGHIIYGRKCFCAPQQDDIYCPVEATICKVSLTDRISCHEKVSNQALNLLLPFLALAYLLLLWLCLASRRGTYARGYLRKVCSGWTNEQYQEALHLEIDRMVQRAQQQRIIAQRHHRNPNRVYYHARHENSFDAFLNMSFFSSSSRHPRAVSIARQVVREQRDSAEAPTNVTSNTPTAIGLKTRLYNPEKDKHQDCMICLAELKPTDRIGDLPCGHAYHVEPCLKEWIVRKNHCPLCQASALALPIDLTKLRKNSTALATNASSSSQTENGTIANNNDGDEVDV